MPTISGNWIWLLICYAQASFALMKWIRIEWGNTQLTYLASCLFVVSLFAVYRFWMGKKWAVTMTMRRDLFAILLFSFTSNINVVFPQAYLPWLYLLFASASIFSGRFYFHRFTIWKWSFSLSLWPSCFTRKIQSMNIDKKSIRNTPQRIHHLFFYRASGHTTFAAITGHYLSIAFDRWI